MVKFLRENIKDVEIYYEEYPYEQYRTIHFIDSDIDWIPSRGKMRVIGIQYPPEYYAFPHYLSTKDLTRIFKHSDGTAEGFIKEMKEEITI